MRRFVSVPLRGYGFEIARILLWKRSRWSVSVPLRGYGFEIVNATSPNTFKWKWFPSPYGDMVLKFKDMIVVVSFRPCGFRPLTGIWFWNFQTLFTFLMAFGAVSVPLRGYGFEIPKEIQCYWNFFHSFRPLTGIWFWNWEIDHDE